MYSLSTRKIFTWEGESKVETPPLPFNKSLPHPVQAACPPPNTISTLIASHGVHCQCIWLLAGISGARVMARFMDEIVVGVLTFGLVFMFGSQSHLGWHPCLDGG